MEKTNHAYSDFIIQEASIIWKSGTNTKKDGVQQNGERINELLLLDTLVTGRKYYKLTEVRWASVIQQTRCIYVYI